MARYIDADVLIEMLNNKAKTDYEMGLYNHGSFTQSFIRFVERQPTADVVPKSEVKKLREINSLLTEAGQAWQKRYDNAKAEVAREIFEEIEKITMHNVTSSYGIWIMSMGEDAFAELKKKYAESENG